MQHIIKDTVKRVLEIVKENFPNGIRDDFIDTNKVQKIYSVSCDGEQISRNVIADIIRDNGIEDGGRFYFISDDDAQSIKNFLDEILSAHSIAYYSKIHEKHSDFFAAMHIFSPEVLKKILQTLGGGHFYFTEFCSAKRATRLDYVIAKISADNALTLGDLQEKLPYVPSEKILAILSDAKKYLPASDGKFIPLSKIQFDTDEIDAAKKEIAMYVDKVGYATPEDYDLSSNFALNPELAEKDLRNVIYEKFFSADFTKRGKKLFPKNSAAPRKTSTDKLRKFIAAYDELPVKKLFAAAENFGMAQSVALSIAHEKMIRVDKDYFVCDSLIHFDVGAVDVALTPFVEGKIIALKAVTSFTGFPPVEGCSWNLFLLESFLRKFSQRYTFDTAAANNSNVGAIYPRSMKFAGYLGVQVAAIAQEKIPLEKSAVEEFLIEQGFRATRISKVTERVIQGAQENFSRM